MAGSSRDNPNSNDLDIALDKVPRAAVESIPPPVASYQLLETPCGIMRRRPSAAGTGAPLWP